jgi:hypothetical protein
MSVQTEQTLRSFFERLAQSSDVYTATAAVVALEDLTGVAREPYPDPPLSVVA